MRIFCTERFKKEVDKLKKNHSYSSIESEIIRKCFNKNAEDFLTGKLLNANREVPYIKLKVGGSSGYRLYLLLHMNNDNLYLMFIHPKTGSKGYETIQPRLKNDLYKEIEQAIDSNELFELDNNNNALLYTNAKLVTELNAELEEEHIEEKNDELNSNNL